MTNVPPLDLVIDTETTGMWNFKKPDNEPGQPRMVEVSAVLRQGHRERAVVSLLLTDALQVSMEEEAAKVHGITPEDLSSMGVHSFRVCALLKQMIGLADRLVGHNVSFDMKIIAREFAVHGTEVEWPETKICTMRSAAAPVANKSGEKNTWPRLERAYKVLVDENGFSNAHSALADTMACLAILRALEEAGEELVTV